MYGVPVGPQLFTAFMLGFGAALTLVSFLLSKKDK